MKMRARGAISALLMGLLICAAHATDGAAVSGVTVRHLTGSIYLVEESVVGQTNSLVYIGPADVTVIGATSTPETAAVLAAKIRGLTSRPIREVIDTSPDPEWSGGNAYWKSSGAQIIAAEATYDLLESTWETRVETARKHHPGYPRLPLVLPTKRYPRNFELQGGDVRALYLGPSHTAGDIFVYFPKERVLDAGSILKEQLGNMANADVAAYPKTLRKLQALHLDIQIIISGHWSAIHGPELVDHYLEMLRTYEPPSGH